jgi:hypothetical protein
MMVMTFRRHLLIPALIFCYASFAQTEALPAYTVKLTQSSFASTAFTFDYPFVLTGDVPENCYKISYSYSVKGNFKKWMSLPKGNSFSDEWEKDGDKFTLFCEGMHPNVRYDFKFEIFKNPSLAETSKTELKQKLAAKLTAFSKKFAIKKIVDADLTKLNSDLNTIFSSYLKIECGAVEVRERCTPANKYTLDVRNNSTLNPEFEKIRTANDEIFAAYNDLYGSTKIMEALLADCKAEASSILKDLDVISSGKVTLDPLSAELLKLPFAPSLKDFRTHKLSDGLIILKKLLIPSANLEEFLKGKRKINNVDLEVSDEIEYSSLYFLNALFIYLGDGTIKEATAKGSQPLFTSISRIITNGMLKRFMDAVARHEEHNQDLKELIATFPDFSAQVVLSETLAFEAITITDVASEKTPYISVEGGISYATGFRSALNYTGANFYLSPVNKKALLSTFKGWNKFKKMFCFNVAIGNFFGDKPQNAYSILGESSGSNLLLGAGLRLGRVIKVNVHWLPYKTDNKNILMETKELKSDFLFSIGADINLLKALGNVGKVLKLTE